MPSALNIYLFTANVPTLSAYSSNNTLKLSTGCVMKWKRYERKRSWPNFKPFAGISLEGLKKVTYGLSQYPTSGSGPKTYRKKKINKMLSTLKGHSTTQKIRR